MPSCSVTHPQESIRCNLLPLTLKFIMRSSTHCGGQVVHPTVMRFPRHWRGRSMKLNRLCAAFRQATVLFYIRMFVSLGSFTRSPFRQRRRGSSNASEVGGQLVFGVDSESRLLRAGMR